jgi:hypothetical protein
MPTKHKPLKLKVETKNGRFRVEIPATAVEAEGAEELLEQIEKRLSELGAALAGVKDDLERIILQHIEKVTPRGPALKKLIEKYPAPQEWYNEPEWNDDEPE